MLSVTFKPLILRVVMFNFVVLSVTYKTSMLSVVMLNIVILNAIVLSVVAPI
jgi:hypothetical protein